jgi:hypothetical protein
MARSLTPEMEQKRQGYETAAPKAASTAPSEEAPQQIEAPAANGPLLETEGTVAEQVGTGDSATPAASTETAPAAPSPEAAPDTGGGGTAGGQQAQEPKEYEFTIGGAKCKITDDLSNASVEFPEKELWKEFGPKGEAKADATIPIPGIPALSLKLGASINWLLQVKKGVLSGVTVAKTGSKYSLRGQVDTGVKLGLGVGVSAAAGVDLWLVEGGVGLQGKASIGGEMKVTTAFNAEYDASTGTFKAAGSISTGELSLPLKADVSAFIYVDTLFTDTWKKSFPLINATLGRILVSKAKAGISYTSGEAPDFTLKKPDVSWDKSIADVKFLGKP